MDSALPDFNKLWNFNEPKATEEKFTALLEAARKAGDASYLLQLLTQIARTQGLQGKFAEAHATLDGVQAQLRDDLILARVRCLLERGRVFNSSGAPEKGRPLFVEAWELASAAGETKSAADALHMIAIVEPAPAGKIEWNLRALEYIDKNPQEKRWLNAVYNNLGEAYLLAKDYAKALDCFQKLAEMSRERKEEPWIYTLKDISKCLRLLGRSAEARAVIAPVYSQQKENGESDGWISGELAECLLAMNETEAARALFKEAYAAFLKDEYVVKHEAEMMKRVKEMAG
jgi:tetratricopeptide (TPR) repeat protein